jgi:hypothetical protein
MELLAGTGTAVLLFLVVVGTLAWRCRRHSLTSGSSTIRSKKLVEDVPICRAGEFVSLCAVIVSERRNILTRSVSTVQMGEGLEKCINKN